MADTDEGFLGRWSRLKREAREEDRAREEQAPPSGAQEEPPAADAPAEKPFDPDSLPPVDSLDADSDYTRFLAPEVPQDLRLLALRKAWVSDPKIAGFRGFAEYDWDFNAPGYGQLLPTDNIQDMLQAMFRDEPAREEPKGADAPVTGARPQGEEPSAPPPSSPPEGGTQTAAVPDPGEDEDPRRLGGLSECPGSLQPSPPWGEGAPKGLSRK